MAKEQNKLKSYPSIPTINSPIEAADLQKAATNELVEGVDFTIEDGRYVFTQSYLARRGECCGSGCRNCPFGGESE